MWRFVLNDDLFPYRVSRYFYIRRSADFRHFRRSRKSYEVRDDRNGCRGIVANITCTINRFTIRVHNIIKHYIAVK